MARPIEKKDYQDSDERVATFRISHGKLTAFQEVCAAKETSVSQALIGFIDSVIGGGDIPEKVSHVSLPENLATQDDISKAIAEVKAQLQNELGQAKLWLHETSVTYDVITQLETKFDDKLGDFRSEVADTAVSEGRMSSAIAGLLTKTEFESAKDDIWAELTRLDSAVAMVGNYYEFTGNEEFFNQQENAVIAPLVEEIESLKKLDGIE